MAISGTDASAMNGAAHERPAINGTSQGATNGAVAASPVASPIAPPVASPVAPPVVPPVEESPFAANLWRMGASAVVGAEPTPPDPPPTNGVATATSSPEAAPIDAATVSVAQSEGASEQSPARTTTAAGFDPCSPAPLADGVIDLSSVEPFHAWELLLDRIRPLDEFQCAVLDQVGLIALGDGAVQIMASRGSFSHMELSRHPERRAQLEQAMREHFGAPFAVHLVEGEPSLPDVPSVVLVQQRRRQEHRRVIEAEARSHPALLNLVQTFSGEMTRIKPLSEL
ncbi:MAG: hypothetical protein JKY37_33880 [Nannocystaceae bacterium]|nr:hypothetical protein [Nannocystaceae bacterium]